MEEKEEINLFDGEDDGNEDFTYDLTPYNFNMDVEGLVRRYESRDILIPSFQRNYVWSKDRGAMFIDSILRGLPSPSFFFYEESPQKYLVIDGQQRLLSIYYFIRGVFPDVKQHQDFEDANSKSREGRENEDIKGEPFTLSGMKIHEAWKGKTFSQLTDEQQKRIRNTYLYIVNLKQTAPNDDNSSMYLVFERINTGSTHLYPQQIRLCISHGAYSKFLCKKAVEPIWKENFGIDDKIGTISELILRFISLFYTQGDYKGSMKIFLDKMLKENDNFEKHEKNVVEELYEKSLRVLTVAFSKEDFTPKKSLNGYLILVTWIAIANTTKDIDKDDLEQWLEQNKTKIQGAFVESKKCKDVSNFIEDTRRASRAETLKNVIAIITKNFKAAL